MLLTKSQFKNFLVRNNFKKIIILKTKFYGFKGDETVLLSADSVIDEEHAAIYQTEYLNKLSSGSLPPHKLVNNCNMYL